MCFFIELICEELPLKSSINVLTGNDTLSLAISNSGGATRNQCIFRPSKAFFPLVPQADPIPSLYRSSASREMEGEKLSLRPRPSFLPSRPEQHARPRHARKQQKQQRPQGQMWISPRVSIMVGLTPESWGNECPPRVLIKPKVHLLLSPSYPPFLYACSHESHRRNGLAGRKRKGPNAAAPVFIPFASWALNPPAAKQHLGSEAFHFMGRQFAFCSRLWEISFRVNPH